MFFTTICAAASLGATLGRAIAILAGTSIAFGTAAGTVAGAGVGVVVAVEEERAKA